MTDYITRRFPQHIVVIQSLKSKDAAFNEACDNYDEICAWLAERCRVMGLSARECEDAREQMCELELEILTSLLEEAP